ncbi:hypothetical protein [Streptomyces pseudogriseolus]|uniref:hypothetical protein n=1 Tax=Streptomyces pseudogriseolus TaxID=36817 RepID=UPI003FA249A3
MSPEPPDEALDQLAAELGSNLHRLAELLAPIWDAADGVKSILERRGWSPTVSEELAAEYLKLCMRKLFASLVDT